MVRLCVQLFVGGLMSCLRYLCLLAYSGFQHILLCVFALFCSSSCVNRVAGFSGLSINMPFHCSLAFIYKVVVNTYTIIKMRTITCHVWNSGPFLWQAHKGDGVKHVNGILTFILLVFDLQRQYRYMYKKKKKKNANLNLQ